MKNLAFKIGFLHFSFLFILGLGFLPSIAQANIEASIQYLPGNAETSLGDDQQVGEKYYATEGELLNVNLIVQNTGSSASNQSNLGFDTPKHTKYHSANIVPISVLPDTSGLYGEVLTWDFGSVDPGEIIVVELVLEVEDAPVTAESYVCAYTSFELFTLNPFSASEDYLDYPPEANLCIQYNEKSFYVDMENYIVKRANGDFEYNVSNHVYLEPNDTIWYTATVGNKGVLPISPVTIKLETQPEWNGMDLVTISSVTPTPTSISPDGLITYDNLSLDPGETLKINVQATVPLNAPNLGTACHDLTVETPGEPSANETYDVQDECFTVLNYGEAFISKILPEQLDTPVFPGYYGVHPWIEIEATGGISNWGIKHSDGTSFYASGNIPAGEKYVLCDSLTAFDYFYSGQGNGFERDCDEVVNFDIEFGDTFTLFKNTPSNSVHFVDLTNASAGNIPKELIILGNTFEEGDIQYGLPGYHLYPGDANESNSLSVADLGMMELHVNLTTQIPTIRGWQNAAIISSCDIAVQGAEDIYVIATPYSEIEAETDIVLNQDDIDWFNQFLLHDALPNHEASFSCRRLPKSITVDLDGDGNPDFVSQTSGEQ